MQSESLRWKEAKYDQLLELRSFFTLRDREETVSWIDIKEGTINRTYLKSHTTPRGHNRNYPQITMLLGTTAKTYFFK